MKNLLRMPEFYLMLMTLIGLGLLYFGEPEITSVRFTREGISEETTLPISGEMEAGESFEVALQIHPGFLGPYQLRVHPDDCMDSLYIDGKPFPVNSIEGHCNWDKGFVLRGRGRHISMVLHNGGGPGGIYALASAAGPVSSVVLWGTLFSFAAVLLLLLRRFHFRKTFLLFFSLGVLLRLFYVVETEARDRTYDIDGHLEYVSFIAEKGHLPQAEDCWSCYHPPLYYLAMVPPWKLAGELHIQAPRFLQWISVAFSIIILWAGLLCLQYAVSGGALVIASMLWAFWPGAVLSSPRVGNDILFMLAHVLFLWQSFLYLERHEARHLLLAAVLSWVAVFAKATGMVTLCLWFVVLALGYFPRRTWKPVRMEVEAFATMLLLLVTIAFFHSMHDSLVGNLQVLNRNLRVGDGPGNFLFFDFRDFLTHPYTDGWNDAGGRQYFWNYLAKSSISGEFRLLDSAVGRSLASVLGVCVLGFGGFAAIGLWKMKITRVNVLLVVQGIVFILAMMILRMMAPYACSNDFRYIIPVLLSFVPFAGAGVFAANASLRRRIFGTALVCLFSASSVLLLLLLK